MGAFGWLFSRGGLVLWAALMLTVVTGFSGLVYEVAWEKYLATLLVLPQYSMTLSECRINRH